MLAVDEGAVLWALMLMLLALWELAPLLFVLGARPLVFKLVQLRIITGELSCKSGNEEDIDEEPLIDFVNFEAHDAMGEELCWVYVSLAPPPLADALCWDAVAELKVSMDLRVLNRRILKTCRRKVRCELQRWQQHMWSVFPGLEECWLFDGGEFSFVLWLRWLSWVLSAKIRGKENPQKKKKNEY